MPLWLMPVQTKVFSLGTSFASVLSLPFNGEDTGQSAMTKFCAGKEKPRL